MADRIECRVFEMELQDAMDLRLSPNESCGKNPHLALCHECREMLAGFTSLHETMQKFATIELPLAVTINDRSLDTANSRPSIQQGRFKKQVLVARLPNRWMAPVMAMSIAVLVIAFFPNPLQGPSGNNSVAHLNFPRAESFSGNDSGNRSQNSIPNRDELASESRSNSVPQIRNAVNSNSESAEQSIASCLMIADQIPGVCPVRHSVVSTVDWFWKSIPQPRLPSILELLPDLGQTAQDLTIRTV